ncbi:MAG: hypothetical protein CMP55_01480, partial [Flavobacteriales bacterium]|nr:hypothetical protein [Flavobacteriales bacterium]
NDFNIDKLDTLILKSELKLEPKILSKPISIADTLNIRAKGIAKAPMLFFDYKFDVNYKLLSSDLLYPLVNENLNKSDFRLEITKIKNINLSKIEMLSNVNFKNNFDFDYLIKKLDIKIFPGKELEKELGKSSLKKPILIKKRSEINIENNISLETKKFGFSLVKGIFKKKYSFFITADALIEFNQIQIPLKIIRQINYNPITKEINIQE